MKIGVIGLGVVGKAIRHGFTRIGHDVFGYDIALPETKLEDALAGEVVFVCVSTPTATDGSCDTSIVEQVMGQINEAGYTGLVAVKSTVEPGTTDKLIKQYPHLRIAFCPEFLREKATYTDFVEQHDICVIGTYSKEDFELLKRVHDPLPQNFAHVTPLEAEFAKYFFNVFNALRIVYANQFYDVCKATGADYQKIKNAMTHHRVMPPAYLDCNEKFRGFGGTCLPKDTSAFAQFAKKVLGEAWGLSIFEGIVEINKHYKTTVL
jgi:UDPglucose 6-dehydrogenase